MKIIKQNHFNHSLVVGTGCGNTCGKLMGHTAEKSKKRYV